MSHTTDWRVVVGLEVHTQLLTASKMFCACPNDYAGSAPNSHCCPVCLGAPGAMPTVNAEALRFGIMAALALDCGVPAFSWFERKNYPYPDLMKGFQLTQYTYPIGSAGVIEIETSAGRKPFRINRVHLEEDTAKSTHLIGPGGDAYSLVDCNRSGVPLMEIVSEPDGRSAEEAVAYLRKLRDILVFLGIASGRLEDGAMRLEANVSVRTPEEEAAGILRTRCEIKNLNSFDSVLHAVEYEVRRHIRVYERGDKVAQVTMGWDVDAGRTVVQRSKEEAQDYRYFPEPDLPPLRFSTAEVDAVRAELPELRHQIIDRYQTALGLDAYRADLLAQSRAFAAYFEAALAQFNQPERLANVLLGDFAAQVNDRGLDLETCADLPPAETIAELARQCDTGDITGPQYKQLIVYLFEHDVTVDAAKQALGIKKTDTSALAAFVDQALAANPDAVEKIRAGQAKVIGFLVGQVMKFSRGQADPKAVEALLAERLGD